MTYLYSAALGIAVYFLVYFVVKEAVAAGVKSALSSMDLGTLIEKGVARGMELERES